MNEQVRSDDLLPSGDPDVFTAAQADVPGEGELARLAASAQAGRSINAKATALEVQPATEIHNLMQSAAERLASVHSLFSKLVTVIVGERPPQPELNEPTHKLKFTGFLGTLEADGHDFHSALDKMEAEIRHLADHF